LYYISISDYENASKYLEDILNIYSFDQFALKNFVKIKFEEEKFEELIIYAKYLELNPKSDISFIYMISAAHFELRNYLDALNSIQRLSNIKKLDLTTIKLWRDILVVSNPLISVQFLQSYISTEDLKKDEGSNINESLKDIYIGNRKRLLLGI
jgi:tetratricopeptide (TPR) repeat protein